MAWYKERSQWFQDILDERREGEIAYDNVVLEQVERGKTLEEALEIAGQKYPDEALNLNKKTREDIFNHYEYFINHEQLKKIEQKISDKS